MEKQTLINTGRLPTTEEVSEDDDDPALVNDSTDCKSGSMLAQTLANFAWGLSGLGCIELKIAVSKAHRRDPGRVCPFGYRG